LLCGSRGNSTPRRRLHEGVTCHPGTAIDPHVKPPMPLAVLGFICATYASFCFGIAASEWQAFAVISRHCQRQGAA
jgi:hypothetical protein